MNITFCGAARTVTGSCHLITTDDGKKILLDCGLYQGRELDLENFNDTWKFDPADIDYVVLSHAHIDHSGRLPKLVKDGFRGDIICTFATRDLATIMLLDSAYIQQKDAEYRTKRAQRKKKGAEQKFFQPLYDIEDVEQCMSQFVSIGYGKWHKCPDGSMLTFRDSGHILGSASVTLKIKEGGEEKTIGFTGDIGRPSRPILRDPQQMPHVDYLICESTYGGKLHPEPPAENAGLLEIIQETCVKNKGKLIIPAFSVGRTQEIVFMMDKLANEGKLPPIKVYVDSPLAVNATDIFKTHPECYDREILEYLMTDPDPWGFNKLVYVHKASESKRINDSQEPAVIISASGMITAGRILHHISNNIENPRNTVLIVGYCAEGSIGSQLARGAERIRVFGEEKKVKARVARMHSFSAHGDQQEMIDFLSNQSKDKLKRIFLVHGDLKRQEVFADALSKEGYQDTYIPSLGERVEL